VPAHAGKVAWFAPVDMAARAARNRHI
jgi:hypothetical protein